MPLPRIFTSIVGALSLGALLTLPALAQIRSEPPLSLADNRLVLTTEEQRLVLPVPDWVAADVTGDAVLSSFEAIFRTGDAGADLEIYRNGAIYALATELYGAHLVRDPDAGPLDYRQTIIDGFGRACVPGQVAFVQLGEDPDDILAPLLLVCGAQRANARQGAIMAITLQSSAAGFAVVYQQWRGAAFDPAEASAWPAAPDVIETRARQLQAGTVLTLTE